MNRRALLGSLPSLRHEGRSSYFPSDGCREKRDAKNGSPNSLWEKGDSCYKQDDRADSADAGKHEEADNGEQHRHHGNAQSKQAIHFKLPI